MTYTPIAGIPPQYSNENNDLASNYYLKFYIANTTTPLSMATDATAGTLLVKCKLNANGIPVSNPNDDSTIFIPHVDQSYRCVIYPTEADADSNNTAAAFLNVPDLKPLASLETVESEIDELVGTGDTQVPTNADLPVYPRKNYLVNPSFQVDQEHDFTGRTLGSSVEYIADEWAGRNNTGTGQTDLTWTNKIPRLTATTAVTDLSGLLQGAFFRQLIEAQNVYNLNGKTVTISGKVNTNWTGNLPIAINNYNFSRGYVVDVPVVSGSNEFSVTITIESGTVDANDNGIGLELWIAACNEDGYQTSTGGAWQAGSFICTTNSTQWVKTAGNYVEVEWVKLEEGDTATPFEPNSYAEDLRECQRYSRKLELRANTPWLARSGSTSTLAFLYSLETPMRAPDSAVFTTTATSMNYVRLDGSSASTGAASINSFNFTDNGKFLRLALDALTNGAMYAFRTTADHTLFINNRL